MIETRLGDESFLLQMCMAMQAIIISVSTPCPCKLWAMAMPGKGCHKFARDFPVPHKATACATITFELRA